MAGGRVERCNPARGSKSETEDVVRCGTTLRVVGGLARRSGRRRGSVAAVRFDFRHVNRLKMPTKHVLVCEDDLSSQARIAQHLAQLFEPQGEVVVSYVSGALAACGILALDTVDLIILDHDMPRGNGPDLLVWLASQGRKVPVMTFSGIVGNNAALQALGAEHLFGKEDVISGRADANIRSILGLPPA